MPAYSFNRRPQAKGTAGENANIFTHVAHTLCTHRHDTHTDACHAHTYARSHEHTCHICTHKPICHTRVCHTYTHACTHTHKYTHTQIANNSTDLSKLL